MRRGLLIAVLLCARAAAADDNDLVLSRLGTKTAGGSYVGDAGAFRSLASQLGVVELTYSAKVMNNKGFSPELGFGAALVLYFIISYPLARLGQYMEKRLGISRHRGT